MPNERSEMRHIERNEAKRWSENMRSERSGAAKICPNERTSFKEVLASDFVIKEFAKYDAVHEQDIACHGFSHALNCVEIVEKVARLFELEDEMIDDVKIAALLHDIGVGDIGKLNHDVRSAEFARKHFRLSEEVIDAIRFHDQTGGDSIQKKLVSFADKLDVNKNRITKSGLNKIGHRQYSHIMDTEILIKDGLLVIVFKTDGKLNIQEMMDYPFTYMIFEATQNLASHFGIGYKLFVDEKEIKKVVDNKKIIHNEGTR